MIDNVLMSKFISDNTLNVGIIWPSDSIDPKEIIKKISEYSTIMYILPMDFSGLLRQLIFDVYSYNNINIHKNTKILEKITRLESKNHENVTFVLYKGDTFRKANDIKKSVREEFKNNSSWPEFDIFHSADNIIELKYLKNIIFKKPVVNEYIVKSKITSNLSTKLMVLSTWLKDNKVLSDDVCIVGGAVMDFYGYKFCDDIDIVLSEKIRNKYCGYNAKELLPGLDVVKTNYSKKLGIGNWYTDDELIYNKNLHIISREFKFAKLEIVKERKIFSKRKKDILDLARL